MRKKIIIAVLFLLICFYGKAQTDLNNTGVLHISTGTDTLFVNGGFNNGSSASFINHGKFYLKQDLTNSQASMSPGSGVLVLNGSAVQTIAGSQPFKTNHLITNNAAGIQLNNNLSVSATHTFTAGVITTSSTPNYLIYEAGSSYSGSGDSKHVNGWVKKLGSTDFIFPVGNATLERTIALNNLSATGEFNVRYRASTPNSNHLQSPLLNLDISEYWQITKVTGGAASVAMNWDNNKVSFPNWILSGISAAAFDGSNWIDAGGTATGQVSTTGNVTSNSISSFNLFTFGSKTYPVPLTLISFTAKRLNGSTRINWTTVSEHNVDLFVVERSDDNSLFYTIAQLPARNSGNAETYSSTDNVSINRIAYYRLKCVDKDDKTKFSQVVALTEADRGVQLSLMNNPVRDRLVLESSAQLSGSFDYFILAINGQLVQNGKLSIQNGMHYELPVQNDLKPGTYILQVKNSAHFFHYTFIIQ